MKSLLQLRVRYQETDQMGVVHHSVYYIWFEAGRTEWLREKGLSYRECEERDWLLPLIESGCNYLHPARYDDLVEIETEFTPEKGFSFRFDYVVRNAANGQILAKGFTKHVCINRKQQLNRTGAKLLKSLINMAV